ncbi:MULTISPECIES: aminotransferase class IV [Clostridium]|uniref:Aminotransferase class IV n=1 Tax=Clostridium cibarium TaxID=2762247 RepID=A0ABR8PP39_9CLOT|nr:MULTISPECIES: aminotransferase class IV [Clostridium]MBD7909922.1 aminotransferase class IV [Clostridium cibarium]
MRKIIYEEENILLDEGSVFGKGVFETILWLDKPVFLKEHIERLRASMEVIGLNELEEDMLMDFLKKLKIQNKALKVMVTPLNIVISKRDILYKSQDYKRGMTLGLSTVRKNSSSRLTYIKSICYIENILEKEKAKKDGFDDALFLNERGYLTETSCSNIFLIKSGKIITPKVENGLLSGIIRKWVIENYKVYEKDILFDDLKEADEVFITNSLMGIMKVNKIDRFIYNKETFISAIKDKYDKCIFI